MSEIILIYCDIWRVKVRENNSDDFEAGELAILYKLNGRIQDEMQEKMILFQTIMLDIRRFASNYASGRKGLQTCACFCTYIFKCIHAVQSTGYVL